MPLAAVQDRPAKPSAASSSPGALNAHRDYMMEETLATGWGGAEWSPAYSVEHTLGAERWTIGLARVGGG